MKTDFKLLLSKLHENNLEIVKELEAIKNIKK